MSEVDFEYTLILETHHSCNTLNDSKTDPVIVVRKDNGLFRKRSRALNYISHNSYNTKWLQLDISRNDWRNTWSTKIN